ncbi:MAG: hypothetical protein M1835_003435 [Candelina submexicana]|nr:MAG: hypothetical protein M1835_003435 [Candelina submexicana]
MGGLLHSTIESILITITFLTYLGAANVILIILYGPITQETIQLGLEEKHLHLGSGSILRNLVYQISSPPTDTVDLRTYQQDPHGSTDAIFPSVAPQMKASIVQALTQLPADPSEVRGECQTGNCTYGNHTTMGVCSKVENKTSTIIRRCFEAGKEHQTQTHYTYSVKALQAHPTTYNDNMTTRGDDSSNLWIGASQVDPGPSNAYSFPEPNTLAEFYAIYYPDSRVKHNLDADFDATAVLIALKGTRSLCVYQYSTTMINGTTTTTEVNQPNVNWKTVSKVINNTQITAISGTDMNNTEYWISEGARWAFNKYLTIETFHGTGKTQEDTSQPDKIITEGDTDAARSLSAVLIDQKGGVNGLSKFLDNLATGMTNGLRTTADQQDKFPGRSTVPEVHIFISFRWLTAPILSIVLSLIFLLAVIVSTSQAGIPPWKGSQVLPLLSLGQSARDKLSMIDKNEESIEQLSRKMRLKLVRTEDSWRLD